MAENPANKKPTGKKPRPWRTDERPHSREDERRQVVEEYISDLRELVKRLRNSLHCPVARDLRYINLLWPALVKLRTTSATLFKAC